MIIKSIIKLKLNKKVINNKKNKTKYKKKVNKFIK